MGIRCQQFMKRVYRNFYSHMENRLAHEYRMYPNSFQCKFSFCYARISILPNLSASIRLIIFQLVCPFAGLTHLLCSVSLCLCLTICISALLSFTMPFLRRYCPCLSVCLSVSLSVCLSVFLSVCLSVCLSVFFLFLSSLQFLSLYFLF